MQMQDEEFREEPKGDATLYNKSGMVIEALEGGFVIELNHSLAVMNCRVVAGDLERLIEIVREHFVRPSTPTSRGSA